MPNKNATRAVARGLAMYNKAAGSFVEAWGSCSLENLEDFTRDAMA